MAKHVLIVASGDTDRLAIPWLLNPLVQAGVTIADVRIPPRHRDVTPQIVEKMVRGVYWEFRVRGQALDKVVVLKDADGRTPEEVLAPFSGLSERLGLGVALLFACAQQHLEAWFFADAPGLRAFLGRDLGDVDASKPDEIRNPKQHLKNLLGLTYTRFTAESIARRLDPRAVEHCSPSFRSFTAAVRNGG